MSFFVLFLFAVFAIIALFVAPKLVLSIVIAMVTAYAAALGVQMLLMRFIANPNVVIIISFAAALAVFVLTAKYTTPGAR